jgi:hypothetical protein
MLRLASRGGLWAQSLRSPTSRECLAGPTWQCNHATLPLLPAFQPFQNLKSLSFPGAYKRTPSSPARSTQRLHPLHGQSHLPPPATATTPRGRGGGDGAAEAPEAAARRPGLRLVPATRAAEEAGAEAGSGDEAAATDEEGEAPGGGHRVPRRGAPSRDVRPAAAAAAAHVDARPLPPSPPLQLVSCVRALCLCVRGWRWAELNRGLAFLLLRLESLHVLSSLFDPLVMIVRR